MFCDKVLKKLSTFCVNKNHNWYSKRKKWEDTIRGDKCMILVKMVLFKHQYILNLLNNSSTQDHYIQSWPATSMNWNNPESFLASNAKENLERNYSKCLEARRHKYLRLDAHIHNGIHYSTVWSHTLWIHQFNKQITSKDQRMTKRMILLT